MAMKLKRIDIDIVENGYLMRIDFEDKEKKTQEWGGYETEEERHIAPSKAKLMKLFKQAINLNDKENTTNAS